MASETELQQAEGAAKRCPFCGCRASLYNHRDELSSNRWVMRCPQCRGKGPPAKTWFHAVKKWNQRYE